MHMTNSVPAQHGERVYPFRKAVLCFGLPWAILYRGINYFIFRMAAGDSGLHYPWLLYVGIDIPIMLGVSALWWLLWKRRAGGAHNQADNSRST
jgi:hypothetical protein